MIQYMKELGMELKEIKEIPVPERVQGSLVSGSKISILDGSLDLKCFEDLFPLSVHSSEDIHTSE